MNRRGMRGVTQRWLAALAIVIGVPTGGVCILHTFEWIGKPFPGFFVLENKLVPTAMPYQWTGSRAGVPFLAEVVAMEGHPVSQPEEIYAHARTVPVGTPVRYTVRKGENVVERVVATMQFGAQDYWQTFGIYIVNGVVYLICGVVVALLQPGTPAARGFLMATLTWGLFAFSATDLYGPYRVVRLHLLALCVMPAALIHLAAVFPTERSFVKRQPMWLLVPYAAGGVLTYFATRGYYAEPPQMGAIYGAFIYAALSLVILIGLASFGFWENRSLVVRLRIRVVLLAALVGLALPAFVFVNNAFSGGDVPMNYMGLTPPIFFAGVGYAIAKHDLFDIDVIVKRTFVYVVLTMAISGLYALTLVLLQQAGSIMLSRTPLFNVLFVVLVAVLFDPLRMGIQHLVDRTFYRARLDYRRTLAEISRDLTSFLDIEQVATRVTHTLVNAMQVEAAAVALWGEGKVEAWSYPAQLRSASFDPGGPLAQYLATYQHELFALTAEERIADVSQGRQVVAAMAEARAELVIPLLLQGVTVGCLALGQRKSGRAFNSEDVHLLTTLADETAIAMQNARRYRRLTELMQQLEAKVEERTSELRASHAELGAAYDHLKSTQTQLVHAEKMASLGRLVAGVAHEINNPVSFVASAIRPLRQRLEAVTRVVPAELQAGLREAEELVDIMARGAERTVAIVKDLRAFSRVGEEHRKAVDLHEGLDVSVRLLESRWRERITIHRDFGALPRVECDPGQINQVFMNLLANACEAIKGEGSIWITTRAADGEAWVTIRDDGCGMTREVREHIFDPFFTTKDVGGGTGLGLAISHGILTAHGGRIAVESETGLGATFNVVLPISAHTNPLANGIAAAE